MATAGRRRGKLMGIGRLLAPDSEPAHWWLYPLARVARWAPRAALDFFCVMHGGAGRLPGQGAVADRWPQPRRGDGRECIEFASETAPALRRATFGRPRDPKIRQCIESASETASACIGLRFPHAREAASPLFFFANPVGGAPLEQRGATGSMPTAGRRRGKLMGFYFLRAREAAAPLFFFTNPVAALRWSSEELRGRCRRLSP